jgi:hypothetical protein
MSTTSLLSPTLRTSDQLISRATDAPACPPLPAAVSDMLVRRRLRRVEHDLRARDVRHLPASLQQNRLRHLDELHRYWQRGVFPRNYEHAALRVPCFIDANGRRCAVAHLMTADGQTVLTEQVAEEFNDARIRAMDIPELHAWADQAGLTVDELARIQPTYPPDPRVSFWLPLLQAAMAMGVVTFAVNIVMLVRKRMSWIFSSLGVLIGLLLLVFRLVVRGLPPDGGTRPGIPFGQVVLVGTLAFGFGFWRVFSWMRMGRR